MLVMYPRRSLGIRGALKGCRQHQVAVLADQHYGVVGRSAQNSTTLSTSVAQVYPDGMLHALLVQAIGECAAWVGRDPDRGGVVDHTLWVSACQRTDIGTGEGRSGGR